MTLVFDRTLDAAYGEAVRLSPLVARLLAPNPGPFTFQGTGVYILGAGASVALIDPGPAIPEHIEALKRALDGRRLSHILITHTHNDHSPAAAPLKPWSGAKTYAAGAAAAGTATEAAVDEAHDHAFVPDVVMHDGDLIAGDGFTLECVVTPGHTANHMCFALLQEKALFSGDHVMGWSTSVIAPPDGAMGAYMASLEKLIAREDAILYPTHGSPIAEPQAWLRELLAHRHLREAQILAALRRGADTVPALVERLYPDIAAVLRPAAATQVMAHLAYLADKGAVTQNGVSYRPSS
jgi:glyoxylase-like metal-dependent hydrolase (beta-lactamase superfamily II)